MAPGARAWVTQAAPELGRGWLGRRRRSGRRRGGYGGYGGWGGYGSYGGYPGADGAWGGYGCAYVPGA